MYKLVFLFKMRYRKKWTAKHVQGYIFFIRVRNCIIIIIHKKYENIVISMLISKHGLEF